MYFGFGPISFIAFFLSYEPTVSLQPRFLDALFLGT